MRYRLLGPIEVSAADGTRIAIGARKRRALLAVLALEANRVVSTDRIIEALWGEEPPPAAIESLHAHVSRLRHDLRDASLRTAGRGYVLDVPDGEVDVRVFEELAARGRRAIARGATETGERELTTALAAWRGPALEDLLDEPFAGPVAARLDELQRDVNEDRIDAGLALGRHVELVPELEAHIRENPLRERAWIQLMLALYRSGRQADALAAYRRLRTILVRDLGIDPSPAAQDLEGRILRQDPSLAPAPSEPSQLPINLPSPLTALLGRREELETGVRTLRSERLLTLTGPGGVGKTRLGIAIAHALLPDNEDGVLFVDLSPVRDPALVISRIGEVVSGGERPADVIGDRHMLLLLDNFEQVIDAAPDVADLLVGCPNLRALVTSRAPLRVRGEHRLEVPPLDRALSATLFTERARATMLASPLEARIVDEVVAQLDGLPLALELAAARIRVLSPVALRDRLSSRLAVLASGPRDAPDRHRTLRETIAWSYELLTPGAQAAFRKLSVLAGSFDLEAALAVAETDVDGIADLVDQSLLRRVDARFAMLDSIQEFAAQAALAAGDAESARARHGTHFCELATRIRSVPPTVDGGRFDWVAVTHAERANLRRAFDWAVEVGDDRATYAVFRSMAMYLVRAGAIDEGIVLCEHALPAAQRLGTREEMSARLVAAEFPRFGGDLDRGLALKLEAIHLARELGELEELATGLDDAACIYSEQGEFDRAEELLAEALALRERSVGERLEAAHSWATGAEIALRAGRIAEAERRMGEVIRVEQENPTMPTWDVETGHLKAEIDLAAGRVESAMSRFLWVIEEGCEIEFRSMVAHALDRLALLRRSQAARSARLIGMADRVHAEARSPMWDPVGREQLVQSLGEALGATVFERERAAGHSLSLPAIAADVAATEGALSAA